MGRIKGSMTHKLIYIFLFFIFISAGLTLIRFAIPAIDAGICTERGRGARTVTNCLGLIEFKGDDLFSIYRVSLAKKKRWRNN